MPTDRRHFDLIAVVDFSAAAKPGTARPQPDRCWAAFTWNGWRSEPCYFPTRWHLLRSLADLISGCRGAALVAWDFPFGYPAGSGLGGGRGIAQRYFEEVEDRPNDQNNRFEVARTINQEFPNFAGPFWGVPDGKGDDTLRAKRPKPWPHKAFREDRVAETVAKNQGNGSIKSVWQLNGAGCVGGQAIMGLAAIERLNLMLRDKAVARYWPFETNWEEELAGVVHAECWPTLFPLSGMPFAINDARQVMAVRDALEAANEADGVRELLACPAGLTGESRHAVETEEGWILGLKV